MRHKLEEIFERGGNLKGNVTFSFEFFPPKTPEMEAKLWNSIKELEPLSPKFVSVTYGAGGSTRERTYSTIARVLKETSLTPAVHLTCVAATKSEIDQTIKSYWDLGVRHIVALRGDVPGGKDPYQPSQDGYAYAVDLVRAIKKIGDFEVSVAAYPETHPEAPSPEFDIDNLKRKFDEGANRAITQYFFNPELFFRFIEKCEKKGIKNPIVPGLLPVGNLKQAQKFSAMCGTTIPKWLIDLLEPLENNPEIHNHAAVAVAVEQCRIMFSYGVKHIHFYTLNRSDLTHAICHISSLS